MTITFPNQSRSYDATRRAVRFWGYDRSMESSFFIMADALKQIQPNLRFDPVDILRAFDANRERIYAPAARVYARGRRGSYDLNIADV
jgi:hypothetical protein